VFFFFDWLKHHDVNGMEGKRKISI